MLFALVTIVGAVIMAAGGWANSLGMMSVGTLVSSIALFSAGFISADEDNSIRIMIFILAIITYIMTAWLSTATGIIIG